MPQAPDRPKLILASGSPRRRELLERIGLEFEVRPADVDEAVHPDEAPDVYVRRLALAKAGHQVAPDEVVLAADTTVAVDGQILGKPNGLDEAENMLRRLSGRTHRVYTGVALAFGTPGDVIDTTACTTVRFAQLSDRQISWYLATGEGADKAGSYAVQGRAALFVEQIEGNFDNVVGLPLAAVEALLSRRTGSLLDWVG